MSSEELRERVANKALAKLVQIDRDIRVYEEPMGNVSDEQREGVIEHLLREKEVWKFILNSAS